MKRWSRGCGVVLTCLALTCLLCGCDGQPVTDDSGRTKPVFTSMPQLDPPGGAFAASVSVQMTCATSGAEIYYTTDGSTPSDINGTLYTEPVALTATTTLQACAYSDSSMPSLVVSGFYTVASNAQPTIGNASVIGAARPGVDASITILCTAADADGYIKSVVADLSQLGGIAAQQMVKGPGGQWNWSGTVRPATAGRKEVRLTATDDQGALAGTVVSVDASTPVGTEKWRLATQGPILSTPAIAADGTIYFGSSDRNLYAIRPDGSRKWTVPAGAAIAGTPAIGADGTIYFAVSGMVHAVTPSGSTKWSLPITGEVYSSVAIGAHGMIYVGTTNGTLLAIKPDGTHAWQVNLGASIESSPSVDAQGTIHVGTFNGKLHAIYAGGRPKWTFLAGSTIMASPAIGPDGTVYVGDMNGRVRAINPDGTEKWSVQRGTMVLSSAAIGGNNTLYVGANNKTLAALDAATGAVKWEFTAAGAVSSSPTLASDGTVYFGSTDGTVYAVDSAGKPKWSLKTQGQVLGSAAIASDGTVYIGSADRQLYAIAAAVGPASGPWPTYRGGLKRTGAVSNLPTGNLPPIVTRSSPTGTLVAGRTGSLSVSCYAVDPDGILAGVTADLSAILAGTVQPLVQGAGDTWAWSGAIVPESYGNKTVTFTATDAEGATYSQTAAVRVLAAPRFVNWAVYGDLFGATETEVTISCVVQDPDGSAYPAVKVDLSAIGGAAAQVLAPDPTTPNRFTWTGQLTPPAKGTYPILFTATDADNVVENQPYNVTVANAVPQLGIVSLSGRPLVNQDSPISITVTANDADGTVTGVTADLSQIGGPAGLQPLTNTGSDVWKLTTSVLATQVGVWPVKIVATDDSNGTMEIIWDVTVAGPPAVSNIELFPTPALNTGIQSEVTVRCTVVDPQNGLILPVLADLSAIGGPAAQSMAADPVVANRFFWTGNITPMVSGNRQITVRATNTDSFTTIEPYVTFVDNKPSLSNLVLAGPLILDTNCTVTLSCSAVDVDGRLRQVSADLSSIGGLPAEVLQPIGGGQYSWTGAVLPRSHGPQTVTVKMLDDLGVTTNYSLTAHVVYAPTISAPDVIYTGELLANDSKTLTARCDVDDPDATLVAVRADLSWLGGSSVQPLANAAGDTWSWKGDVLPSAVGDMVVTFTAITYQGLAVSAQMVVTVTGSVPLISNIQLSGSVLADLAAPLTITCRADDATGIVGVTADLAGLGVPARADFALNSVTGLWVWSGTVMPTSFGDKTVTITATAASGTYNTATVIVPVHAASKWAAPLSLGGVIDSSPAGSPDGSTVYIGSTDGKLYAVNADGSVKWTRPLGGSVQSSPAVSSDGALIYVGSGDGGLYAVTYDNNQAWRFQIGKRVFSSPALALDEKTVYVGADDGNLYAVDAILGTIKPGWPAVLAPAVAGPPAVPAGKVVSSPAVSNVDGTIYVGAYRANQGWLCAVKPDGTLKWQFQAAGMVWSSPAIGRSPNPGDPATTYRVYFASFGAPGTGSTLYALDQDGNQKWSFPLGGTSAYSSPVIGTDGTIYIGSDSGGLYAVDPQDGLTVPARTKWQLAVDGAIRSAPAVGQVAGQPTVYVGTSGGTLYAVDGTNGTVTWSLQVGADIRSSALVTSDGLLYFASYNWNLYAIDVTGGPASSTWPMFRGGELRQGLPQ